MVNVSDDQIRSIGNLLADDKRPLKERFRALFTLRNIGGPIAISCIENAFSDSSALLKHELAYCLGQMQDTVALPALQRVLEDGNQEDMVRHEAGEAMGAIGSEESLPILEKYSSDAVQAVAETCQLALQRIKWVKSQNSQNADDDSNPYKSVDPAPPTDSKVTTLEIAKLKDQLVDTKTPLFDRYRAMFALRNLRSDEAVEALCEGLFAQDSALFRHEIAFVLGQLQNEVSVVPLTKVLENSGEDEMVRHECAEALGAIATPACTTVLKKYLKDDKRVVSESCEIALDMSEYENSPEFQYANALNK